MNAREFFDLTAQLREVQKQYFSTPPSAYMQKSTLLKQSKRLEAQLDAEIKRVRQIIEEENIKAISPSLPGFGD